MFRTEGKPVAAVTVALIVAGAGAGLLSCQLRAAANGDENRTARRAVRVANADPAPEDKLQQEVERLKRENERLSKELQDLRSKVAVLERKVRPVAEQPQPVHYQGKPVAYWVEQFRDRDPAYRIRAVKALAGIVEVDKSVLPLLLDGVRDSDRTVRAGAAEALSGVADDAMPALTKMLQAASRRDRKAAAYALASFGADAKPAIPLLIRSLKDPDADVRAEAAGTLAQVARMDPGVIHALLQASKSDRGVRDAADWGFTHFAGSNPAGALVEGLDDKDEAIRARAAADLGLFVGLGFVGRDSTKWVAPNLVEALRDRSAEVRRQAAKSLTRYGSDAVSALLEALKDRDVRLRVGAAGVLGEIGAPAAESAAPALLQLTTDDNREVREAAQKAYQKVKPGAKPPAGK